MESFQKSRVVGFSHWLLLALFSLAVGLLLFSTLAKGFVMNQDLVTLQKRILGDYQCGTVSETSDIVACFQRLHPMLLNGNYRMKPELTNFIDAYASMQSDYGETCNSLLILGAKTRLTEPLDEAVQNEDWEGVQACLAAIEESRNSVGFVSAFKVSTAYYQLALFHERIGDFKLASFGLQKSVEWSPVSWAAPITRLATIYKLQGHVGRAENLLIGAAANVDSSWNAFHILRQLASLWAEQGKTREAHCAYRLAMQFGQLSPVNQVPVRDKEDVSNALQQLELTNAPTETDCHDLLVRNGIGDLQND